MVNFSSLKHDSDKKNTLLASKCKISRGEWVKVSVNENFSTLLDFVFLGFLA